MAHPNWSRPLPQPLVILLSYTSPHSLRCVRCSIATWRYVREKLDGCGRSSADRAEVGGGRIPTEVKPYLPPAIVAMLYVIAGSLGGNEN
jgi:hypothetical protein